VFYGCPQIGRLSHYFLPRWLVQEKRVLYLDGANRFDPLLLVRLARERGHNPAEFNRNVRIARAFTCFQLTELLARAPRLLRSFPADVVLLTALPELYFDEDVREPDAFASFRQALQELQGLTRILPVAVFSDASSFLTPRRKLFRQLTTLADYVSKFTVREDRTLAITDEKSPGVSTPTLSGEVEWAARFRHSGS
jgi:hypothetical protein